MHASIRSNALRVVFFGSPQFAVPSLSALATHPDIDVTLVVTQPDRPAGRGRALVSPAVKVAAHERGLAVYQPETLRSPEAVARLSDARADAFVVVAYGEILRRNILDLAPLGCVNVHPSLLPAYRGATPIPAAILNGDVTTGVTVMKLVRQLDAGPIIAQREVAIEPGETAGTLGERLAAVAADMLPGTLLGYAAGRLTPVAQDDARATYTREWTPDDARIDWNASALEIERLVRASNPWPVAWTTLSGERFRIHAASVTEDAPGSDFGRVSQRDGAIVVTCGSGSLELVTVQPAGKRAMDARDWWRGLRADTARFDQMASQL